jgi:hypothetical protein
MSIDIVLNRVDRLYRPGEKVTGAVVVRTEEGGGAMSHNGIQLKAEGAVALQLSARSVGLFEAFYSSLKPVGIFTYGIEITPSGRVPEGTTEFPFEFVLKAPGEQRMYETYHGVYVTVSYTITVDMARSLLAKNLTKQVEIVVEAPLEEKSRPKPVPFTFSVSPESLQNVKAASRHKIPEFLFEGKLDSTVCDVSKPFVGEIVVRKCAVDIKSIELQLVRVETCTYLEGEAREATEIQNIQIADGNVVHNLPLPIYMIFPRLFTCSTTIAKPFKVEFEINLIVLFADQHMVTENFPIRLFR